MVCPRSHPASPYARAPSWPFGGGSQCSSGGTTPRTPRAASGRRGCSPLAFFWGGARACWLPSSGVGLGLAGCLAVASMLSWSWVGFIFCLGGAGVKSILGSGSDDLQCADCRWCKGWLLVALRNLWLRAGAGSRGVALTAGRSLAGGNGRLLGGPGARVRSPARQVRSGASAAVHWHLGAGSWGPEAGERPGGQPSGASRGRRSGRCAITAI